MYKRPHFEQLLRRLKEPRNFIQVLAGPRQTGKTTLVTQALEAVDLPSHYVSADDVANRGNTWIHQQWEIARLKTKTQSGDSAKQFILVFDEVQKINNWTETVKKLWDEDTRHKRPIKLVLLGSSPLLLQKGLEESLGGRFEVLRIFHWPFKEMQEAFGLSFEEYIYFGGYPGSMTLVKEENRWRNYVRDALIETTISKDVLMMNRVDKPALLRQLFEVGTMYSGQILSFNKLIGQLQDAGNTTTLAQYLKLLSGAGMLTGIAKFAGEKVRQKSSSPKFQVLNNAFLTAQSGQSFKEWRSLPIQWGRLVESAVGAYLENSCKGSDIHLYYWREKDKEVDFVLEKGNKRVAIEVKSSAKKEKLPGLDAFAAAFPEVTPLLVGENGFPVDEFLRLDLNQLFD